MLIKALIWHPDKVEANKRPEAEEIFKDIKEAYEILTDGKITTFKLTM